MADGVVRRIRRGDTIQFPVNVYGPPPAGLQFRHRHHHEHEEHVPLGPPQNITGWFAWATLKYQRPDNDGQAIAQVTSLTSAVYFLVPTQGQMIVTFPPTATSGLADGVVKIVYDVQVQDLNANVWTVEDGEMEIAADVTRATSSGQVQPPPPYPSMGIQSLTIPSAGVFATLPAGAMPDGSVAYVPGALGAFGAYFVLLSQSTQTVDGVKCFQAFPAGRWRMLSTGLA